jgi:hypothetical protein
MVLPLAVGGMYLLQLPGSATRGSATAGVGGARLIATPYWGSTVRLASSERVLSCVQ